MKSIIVIGGDKRSVKLSDLLRNKFIVKTVLLDKDECCQNIKDQICGIKNFDAVVLPIPYSKDGIHIYTLYSDYMLKNAEVFKRMKKDQILFYGGIPALREPDFNGKSINIIKNTEYAKNNAFLTAKAIYKLLKNTYDRLLLKKIIITGYGKIASYLTKMLIKEKVNVIIAARKAEARNKAVSDGAKLAVSIENMKEQFMDADYIINTVPSRIFTKEDIKAVKNKTKIMDISSIPHGFSTEDVERFNIKVELQEGLPGRYYPYEEANSMFKIIDANLKEE